jgi:uncharacterized MAPEG superfamily protein
MHRTILVVAIVVCSMVAHAQRPAVGSLDPRDTAIRTILAGFWGHAKDINGQLIEPTSAKDREIVPVSKAAAYRAIEAGNISGLAQWCGLDWEPHYFSLTKAARRMKMVDKQVAFLSVLHGAGQGALSNALKGKACSAGERARAESLLLESLKSGLPADAAQPW